MIIARSMVRREFLAYLWFFILCLDVATIGEYDIHCFHNTR